MIAKETLSKKHIEAEFRRMKMSDPAVLERTIHAFVLLERLALSNMSFLFKGGTSYLAALLLKRQNSYVRYSNKSADVAKLAANRMSGPLQVLDKLKKANVLEGYFYWCEIVRLLPDLVAML